MTSEVGLPMPQQPDMFEAPKLAVVPVAGLHQPRLWVRRLVIWAEPGGEKLRDIPLRPGLNVIWSPDGSDEATSDDDEKVIGHGSGKTLFCRLLRYSLGEQRFADDGQREQIAVAFPNGIVGAEVILDGVCWAVVRPLGIRRRHVAVANGNLDDIASGDGATTSIDPLIDAIEQSIMTPDVASLARLQGGQKAWPIALAWLSRDQECRFNDVLDWRSTSSGSDAPRPASGVESGPRVEAMRAFLMAMTTEEQDTRRLVETLRESLASHEREVANLDWDIKRRYKRLTAQLGLIAQSLPDLPLLIGPMRQAASDRVALAAKLPAGDPTGLAAARKVLDEAQGQLRKLEAERDTFAVRLEAEDRTLVALNNEIPGLSFSAENAGSQVCPICEVPIDRAIAEKCGLSHKLHNPDECRARFESKRVEVQDQQQRIAALKTRRTTVLQDIAISTQSVDRAQKRVSSLEGAIDARSTAWQEANRIQYDVERFAEMIADRDQANKNRRICNDKLTAERERLGGFRTKQGQVFAGLTNKFAPIVRRLINPEAKGTVTLNATGFDIKIDAGGDRRTSAIQSLKVIAFDLSCLCLSIEGATRVPSFFIHDSPREADLGLSIYDEIFHMVRDLETLTAVPLFQYIITTTTRPPEGFRNDPWLALTLRGAPGSERLLRRDL
jgi:hypothetical protein